MFWRGKREERKNDSDNDRKQELSNVHLKKKRKLVLWRVKAEEKGRMMRDLPEGCVLCWWSDLEDKCKQEGGSLWAQIICSLHQQHKLYISILFVALMATMKLYSIKKARTHGFVQNQLFFWSKGKPPRLWSDRTVNRVYIRLMTRPRWDSDDERSRSSCEI